MMKHLLFLFSTAFLLVCDICEAGSEAKKTNVILVMTDDQGYGELSFHGNPVLETPNLDQLARQSLRFTDYHADPICIPTKGQLMTACEWLDVFVDQQRQIRRGTLISGYWCLEVTEADTYDFELRRWPKEIDVLLMGKPASGGTALPFATARLFISDVHHLDIRDKKPYGFESLKKAVELGQTSVTFNVELETGPMALHTWFDDENGEPICSAYYVYVTKKMSRQA